jgi:hypothetical protein
MARATTSPRWRSRTLSVVAFVRDQVTAGTSTQIERTWPGATAGWLSPFRSVNGYGCFA